MKLLIILMLLIIPSLCFAGSYANIGKKLESIREQQKKDSDTAWQEYYIKNPPAAQTGYSDAGHSNTVNVLNNIIGMGELYLDKTNCGNTSKTNPGKQMSGFELMVSVKTCEDRRALIGMKGDFQCATCSGEWGFEGYGFNTQSGTFISASQRKADGFDVEFSSSILSISHKSLGYKVIFKINSSGQLPLSRDTTFNVIEVSAPQAINQVNQYLHQEQGKSVNSTTTYKAIDKIWQQYAEQNNKSVINAINFASNLIANPDLSEQLINNYFAKK